MNNLQSNEEVEEEEMCEVCIRGPSEMILAIMGKNKSHK